MSSLSVPSAIPQSILDQLVQCAPLQESERQSIERLLKVANGNSSQSRIAANFLLAWSNAPVFGGFDLTDLWRLDTGIAADMLAVFLFLMRRSMYPDALVTTGAVVSYEQQLRAIARKWRS